MQAFPSAAVTAHFVALSLKLLALFSLIHALHKVAGKRTALSLLSDKELENNCFLLQAYSTFNYYLCTFSLVINFSQ